MSGTARIPLSGKKGVGKFAIIDIEDIELASKYKWHLNSSGYAVNRTNGKTIRLHRLINKTPDNMLTDHKNKNRLDNRKCNLRSVTHKENGNNRSNVKGYTFDVSRGKWLVRYKGKFYGRFNTEEEAKQRYQLARSGVEHTIKRNKYFYLPTSIFKQFGKYRVRPQRNGKKIWLGQYATLLEAEKALKEWQER